MVAGDLVVRAARPGDARALAEVLTASRRLSLRDLVRQSDLEALSVEAATARTTRGLAEPPAGSAVFVAELSGRLVGYVYVLPSSDDDVPAGTSEIGGLYVLEEVAGTGVAQPLLRAAIDHARDSGHGQMTAWVRPDNGRARRFYEKIGLRLDGAERSGPDDVLPIEIDEIRYRMPLEDQA